MCIIKTKQAEFEEVDNLLKVCTLLTTENIQCQNMQLEIKMERLLLLEKLYNSTLHNTVAS